MLEKYIKSIVGEDCEIGNIDIYIPINYVVSARNITNAEDSFGRQKETIYDIKCSMYNQENNCRHSSLQSAERLLNNILSGKSKTLDITIYITPTRLKDLPEEYSNEEFVINDFKDKVSKYVSILKLLNEDKYKDFDVKNLDNHNIIFDCSGIVR